MTDQIDDSERARTSLVRHANSTAATIMEAIERDWKGKGATVEPFRRMAVAHRVSQSAFLGETDIERIKAYALRSEMPEGQAKVEIAAQTKPS